jgi:heat shock protein HtpX
MVYGKVSFFDAIEANKRNSLLLILFLSIIFMVAVWALSYSLDIGICGPVFGFFAIVFYAVAVFYAGDKVILAISRAKKVEKKDYPFLFNVVEGLSIASNIPMPDLYVVQDPSPNAFATGRDPKHASVAVTTGLLDIVTREELEGVVAHEISHVANYDIRFMMVAVVFVGAIGLIADFGIRIFAYGGGRRKGGGGLAILSLLFMIIAPIAAYLVKMAISRQREYLADANAAKLTRYPEGLASALEKITSAGIPTKSADDVTASLYISNPFPTKKLASFLSTHPDPKERIKKLRSM